MKIISIHTICTFMLLATVVATAQQRDSLDIKIGQMILIGMPKAEVDPKVLDEVRRGKAGSIIYFEKNIPRDNPYDGLKKMSWTYQKAAPIPLFIAIDQEGGKVNRLKEKYGFPRSVSAGNLGKTHSLDSVRFYGETTAATLVGLGINVNFAPVVDLASNPNNPIIAKVERSYSANADSAAQMAAEFIKPHRQVGVVSVLKHFPGHGSSRDDTHLGLADVTNTWKEDELKPYQTLINQGLIGAIMTAHIVNKKLDPAGLPGTLSKMMIDSLLRKRIGFNGVVFSDDMQMHAITKHYGVEEAIRLAINAGVDILCFSNNIQGSDERTVDHVHRVIRNFVASGAISEQRINESFERIMKLKKQFLMPDLYDPQKEIATLERELHEMELANDSLTNQIHELQTEIDKLKEEGNSKKKKSKKN